MSVRVRFPPSPTGSPHIGNIRTAVFNWLYARKMGGQFILRIEDTDRSRLVPGSLEEIMYDLRWLGLQWDEGPEVGGPYGPYIQSERVELYREHAAKLVELGRAYRCYCTPERLEELRREQAARKERTTGYDRRCRSLSREERERLSAESPTSVIRFAMPTEGQTRYLDAIRGEVTFDNSLQEDFVILKSDGYPTYHLANVVDDHLMRVTHVIRGEEWVSSMPKHLELYKAFGWEPPVFAHPSLILGPDRKRLAKRHGPTAFTDYIKQGYLPETMLNYLALLGWSAGEDRDLYSREELIEKFSIEGITNHPAVFDVQKLMWMNGQYIRMCDVRRLTELVIPYLAEAGLIPLDPGQTLKGYLLKLVPLIQDRLRVLSDAPGLADIFLKDELEYEEKGARKWLAAKDVPELLRAVADRLESLPEWNLESIEEAVRTAGAEHGREGGQVIHPVRMAATGRTIGPGLFETLEVLGRERVVRRLRDAASRTF